MAVTEGSIFTTVDEDLVLGGIISGTVTDSETLQPVNNVLAYVYDLDQNCVGYGWTDEYGYYETAPIHTGIYKLRLHDYYGRYAREWFNDASAFAGATEISVTEGNTTIVDEDMTPGGSISGIVTSVAEPAGINGLKVYLYDCSDPDNWVLQATTQNGIYQFNNVFPSDYKVCFSPISGMDYSEEWYDNQPDFASAGNVTVTSGVLHSGVDAFMEAGGSISGQVTSGSSPGGIEGIAVTAYAPDGDYARGIHTDADGNYSLTSLATGTYKVCFNPGSLPFEGEWYDNMPDLQSATGVPVTAGSDTPDIDAVLHEAGSTPNTPTSPSEPPYDVYVEPSPGLGITFSNVAVPGDTTVTTTDTLPEPVSNYFNVGTLPVYYDINTTAGFSGTIAVTITYNPNGFTGDESALRLYQLKDGQLADITTGIDTENNTITGETDHFCYFAVGIPNQAPVADAGPDITLEATSSFGAMAILDGSGSCDLDADLSGINPPYGEHDGRSVISYIWTGEFGTITGENPEVILPLGSHDICLTVSDGLLEASDTINVTVADTIAPMVSIDGVADGGFYLDAVSATVVTSDEQSGIEASSVTLDGEPYLPGALITSPGAHTLEATACDYAGNTTTETVHFTLYATTGLALNATSCEYSDSTTLTATLTSGGNPAVGETVFLKVNGAEVGTEVTGADGVAVLDSIVTLPAGAYVVEASMPRDDLTFLEGSQASSTLTVAEEKADIAYTGQYLVQYPANLTFSAKVSDEADTMPGDLARARVLFDVSRINGDGSLLPVGSYIVSCDILGNASTTQSPGVGVYSITVSIIGDGYYAPSSDSAVAAVYSPEAGKTTGGGWINVTDPQQGILGKANLGFSVKYKDGAAQGELEFNCKDIDLKLKAKQIDWLVIFSNLAIYQGTGSIAGREGDFTFAVYCVDNGASGNPDKFTIKIWEGTDPSDANLIYKAANVDVEGGNIKVKAD